MPSLSDAPEIHSFVSVEPWSKLRGIALIRMLRRRSVGGCQCSLQPSAPGTWLFNSRREHDEMNLTLPPYFRNDFIWPDSCVFAHVQLRPGQVATVLFDLLLTSAQAAVASPTHQELATYVHLLGNNLELRCRGQRQDLPFRCRRRHRQRLRFPLPLPPCLSCRTSRKCERRRFSGRQTITQ